MINKMRIPELTLTREKVLEENKRVHKLEDAFYLDRHPEQTNRNPPSQGTVPLPNKLGLSRPVHRSVPANGK